MLTQHLWSVFGQLNEAGKLLDFDFAIDKLDDDNLPDEYKGQHLLLMRRKSTGTVYGYHAINVQPEFLQGLMHGILFSLTSMNNFMAHQAEQIATKAVLNPANRIENKDGN